MVSYEQTICKMSHYMIYFYKIYNIYHIINWSSQSKWKLNIIAGGYSLPTYLYYKLMQDWR